jgi:hypothetical protein
MIRTLAIPAVASDTQRAARAASEWRPRHAPRAATGRGGSAASAYAAASSLTRSRAALNRRSADARKASAAAGGTLARFVADSPLERDGFELPVPDERGYGLAFVCRVPWAFLFFGPQLLGFEGAHQMSRPAALPACPGSRSNRMLTRSPWRLG